MIYVDQDEVLTFSVTTISCETPIGIVQKAVTVIKTDRFHVHIMEYLSDKEAIVFNVETCEVEMLVLPKFD